MCIEVLSTLWDLDASCCLRAQPVVRLTVKLKVLSFSEEQNLKKSFFILHFFLIWNQINLNLVFD